MMQTNFCNEKSHLFMCYSSSCMVYLKVLGKLVKPSVLVETIQKEVLLALDFHDLNNQVHDCDLVIGIVTEQTLQKLFDEGNISENQRKCFYQAVRMFLVCATKYLLKWCP